MKLNRLFLISTKDLNQYKLLTLGQILLLNNWWTWQTPHWGHHLNPGLKADSNNNHSHNHKLNHQHTSVTQFNSFQTEKAEEGCVELGPSNQREWLITSFNESLHLHLLTGLILTLYYRNKSALLDSILLHPARYRGPPQKI